MLQPTDRLTLIDAMRPPAGFSLDAAMAVTFTLDLRALLAAPAAFALAGADGVTVDGQRQEPIELLHAVRANAGKLTIFSQVGEIALAPSRRVFGFLERSVIPVRAPRGGIVHPKVWVLRYVHDADSADDEVDRRLRVLVASRNLTFDASWDTVVRLDEAAGRRGADLSALADLFAGLVDHAEIPIGPEHRGRVESLSAELSVARFALPPGVDDLRTHVLGLTPKASPLPLEVDRSLVISPFVSDDFFISVRPAGVDELVSRPESLDLLSTAVLDRIGTVFAFDDGSAADPHDGTEQLSPHDPGRPLVGLHAKVFAFEHDGRARLFLGSANATGAAFRSNVEVLVEMQGSVGKLGIDRLCEGTADELGLRSLFTTHALADVPIQDDQQDAALDGARQAIARMGIEGTVEESGSGWAVTYRSPEKVPVPDAATVHCWPLASPGNRRQVAGGEPLDVRFETTIETISGFLAFEVVGESGGLTGFVVPVPLEGVPEHRERLLLRALVGNAERFLRYLLALLDEDTASVDLLDAVEEIDGAGRGDAAGPLGLPVLEKLLRTMRRNPAKLAGLNPLVIDLAADGALPPGFIELWETIREVAVVGEA